MTDRCLLSARSYVVKNHTRAWFALYFFSRPVHLYHYTLPPEQRRELSGALKKNNIKTGRHARKVKSPFKPPPQCLQHSRCRLLELPRELRNEIYSWVLASTRVTFGEMPGVDCGITPTINKSRLYSLALLYTCHQVKVEIGTNWIGWVLFNFQSPESLLDTLTGPPTAQVTAVRHIRVNGLPVMLSLPHDDIYYRLAWTLKLVPHLQLDPLTVLGGGAHDISLCPAQVDYHTLDELIKYRTRASLHHARLIYPQLPED